MIDSPQWLHLSPHSDPTLHLTRTFSTAQPGHYAPNSACLDAYKQLQGKKPSYIIFRICDDDREIVVDKIAERSSGEAAEKFEEFAHCLTDDEC